MKIKGLGHLIICLGFITLSCFCHSTYAEQAGEPLFNKKDMKVMKYLTSPQFLLDKNTVEIVNKSRERMRIALKVYAERDRLLREQFFKGDIWEKEEQRENFFALKRWLQEISPITNSKEKK